MPGKLERTHISANGNVRTAPGICLTVKCLVAGTGNLSIWDGIAGGDEVADNELHVGTIPAVGDVLEINAYVSKGIRMAHITTFGRYSVTHSERAQ